MCLISVVTPTYNRVHTLPRLYQSLEEQTSKEFEWIVVDDGSTDETEKLIESWKESSFAFTYLKKENGGKHTAVNVGVKAAKGEFIFIVDSDDYLLEDAIKKVCIWTEQIRKEDRFAGVAGLKGYPNGQVIGKRPSTLVPYVDCSNVERKQNRLLGDKAEVYKREILLKYPFPVFKGERFLTEAAVWNEIARNGYQLRWFNEIIYIGEYLEDGLSKKKNLRYENPKGYLYYEKMTIPLYKGLEKWMEIGKLIDLLLYQDGTSCCINQHIKLSKWELALGYICYFIRKLVRWGLRYS